MTPATFRTPLLLALSCFAFACPPLSAGDRPPNLVVLMADDLGAAELGCYGHPRHRTPHLDRLAREGVRFRTCFATPICSPSRVLIMTGRYGFRTGWYNFIGRPGAPPEGSPRYNLGKNEATFADVLKGRGYATALAGKWQLPGEGETRVRDCGFDEYCIWAYAHYLPEGVKHTGRFEGKGGRTPARFWHPSILKNGEYVPTKPADYGPDVFTDFLIDFAGRHRDRPFLLYYPMVLTHTPWEPTPDPEAPGKKPQGLRSNVEYADHVVGRLVAALERLGLREDTVVLFTGDNGTQGAGKARATEAGARVPMIVYGPGRVKAGAVSDGLVDLSDVLPTLADLAGAELPAGREIDGKSFAPLLRGEDFAGREWVFSYLHDRRVLRDRRWLLEGDGRFYDCGHLRHGRGYREVTDSKEPEVVAARARFAGILEKLPAPEGLAPCPYLSRQKGEQRQAFTPRTRIGIEKGGWHLNGKVTCPGTPAEGLLMNVRFVNATFEDRKRPDFDPEANTDRFLRHLPDYADHGVRAITLCLQGGFPGYEGAVNSAFRPDGSLRPEYLGRVGRVIEECDARGVAVILGCYYQRQDQILKDEKAVRAGVVNVVKWVRESGFTNVVLEIANEFPHRGFDHEVLRSPEGQAGLIELAKEAGPGLLVSTSGIGNGRLPAPVAKASDFLLIHFNGVPVKEIPARVEALKRYGKPIVCNEDDKEGEEAARALESSVKHGASWGLMLNDLNQYFPLTFRGAKDDPVVYGKFKELTTR